MSEFVVVKREKRCGPPGTKLEDFFLYYAGYRYNSLNDCGPVFNRTITKDAVFDEPIADAVVRQLTQLGYEVEKQVINRSKSAQAS